jgi:hypothetical protein
MGNHLDFCKDKSKDCKEESEKQEDHREEVENSNEILVVCLCFFCIWRGGGHHD